MPTVGAAGIPARGTASSYSLMSFLLQCRRQECPRLLQLAFSPYFFSLTYSQLVYHRQIVFCLFFLLWA